MEILHANKEQMDLFWRFVYERQAIWHRRFILKQERPWTQDRVLKQYKFTNVYRELDKGTVFYLANVCPFDDEIGSKYEPETYIFRTLVYRIFNHIPTWEALARAELCYPDMWNHAEAWEILEKINNTKGVNVFTNAHIVSPYNSTPGDSKAEKVCHICSNWADSISTITGGVLAAPSLEKLFKYLVGLHGLGPFLAYEVCIDLMYGRVVPFTEDDWANAGPGAMRGANLIYPASKNYLAIMRELRDSQLEHFERLGLDWASVAYPKRPTLSLRGIEHSLCEFQKYERGYRGTGRPRNEFTPTSQRDEAWMEALKG